MFLFQIGAIKTVGGGVGGGGVVGFLFQIGAIKTSSAISIVAKRNSVSIPDWCD